MHRNVHAPSGAVAWIDEKIAVRHVVAERTLADDDRAAAVACGRGFPRVDPNGRPDLPSPCRYGVTDGQLFHFDLATKCANAASSTETYRDVGIAADSLDPEVGQAVTANNSDVMVPDEACLRDN